MSNRGTESHRSYRDSLIAEFSVGSLVQSQHQHLPNTMRDRLQQAWNRVGRITDGMRVLKSYSIMTGPRALLGGGLIGERRVAQLNKCPLHQTPEGSRKSECTGHCSLNKETRCCGDFQSCKQPQALKTYFLKQGLAWGNERETERSKSRWETKRKGSLADLISQSIIEYIQGLSKLLLVTVSFAATIILGMFNRLTGPEASSYVFYLVPISLVTWFTKKWLGLLMSVICALTWLIADTSAKTAFSFSSINCWNAFARVSSFVIFTWILSSVKQALEKERQSSRLDHLTGVRNRKGFIELTELEILRSKRSKTFFTVVYIDLDNFKLVNDRFGHLVGDNLLRLVSRTIQGNVRETDTVARLGGDEFAILLPETGQELAELIIRRIQKNSLDIMQKRGWPVTFSIGAASFAGSSLTVDEVLKKSDDLMYDAKRSGKNTIRQEEIVDEVRSQVTAA